MHEYSLFLSLLKHLEEALWPYKNPRVIKLVLSVGEFSGIDLNYLKEVIENFKEGTPLEETEIVFEKEPLQVECKRCGKRGIPQRPKAQCPFCQSYEVKIVGGLDLLLKSLEIESEDVAYEKGL